MAKFTAAERALLKMARVLNMPPPPRAAVKAEQEAAEAYGEALALLCLAALSGEIERGEFIERFTATVAAELESVYREAAAGEPDLLQMQAAIAEQTEHVAALADDIYGGERYQTVDDDAKKKLRIRGALSRLRDGFLGGLWSRIRMWVNGRIRVRNAGRMDGPPEERLVWRLGATERHCRDCLDANGRIMTRSEWRNLAAVGIKPQSPSLECGGWNCDCSLELVP